MWQINLKKLFFTEYYQLINVERMEENQYE